MVLTTTLTTTAYWKDGSQSQSQSQGEPSMGFLQPSQSQNRGFLQPPSQAAAPKSAGSSSRGTRSQSAARSTRATSQEPARRVRSQSRGVKAESDVSDFERAGLSTTKGKGRASQRSQANGKGKKEQPLFLDTLDEEEDETAATLDGLGPEELEEINLDIDADEDDEDEERGILVRFARCCTCARLSLYLLRRQTTLLRLSAAEWLHRL